MDQNMITSKELRELNPKKIPKTAKELSDKSFWYYTRLATADLILDGQSFWVSNICDMNDLDELEMHEEEKEKIYALCFCNSKSEKIPLWYLYSGIAGKGAALGLTPGRMLEFLNSLKVEGVTKNNDRKPLVIGTEIELRFGWVYYQEKKRPERVLYKNKWYTLSDPVNFSNDNYFMKYYPWEYEKEFRLVFINRTKQTYKRLIVSFEKDLRDDMKLRLAPELDAGELAKINWLKHIGKEPKPVAVTSDLQIKMDLLRRSKKSIAEYLPEYLREEFTQNDPDFKAEELCKLIQDASKCKMQKP